MISNEIKNVELKLNIFKYIELFYYHGNVRTNPLRQFCARSL